MILAQTLISVRTGSERRAEGSLGEIDRLLEQASGQRGHRVLRSFGMSPLASALRDEAGEATLGQVHYVVQSEWDSLDEHDAFYRSVALQMAYLKLSSILSSGPYAILYEEVVVHREHSGVGP
jgi:heme-degrading monooxygenase HmoA